MPIIWLWVQNKVKTARQKLPYTIPYIYLVTKCKLTWHSGACQVPREQSQRDSDCVCDSVYGTQCFGNFISAMSLSPLPL